MSLQVLLEQLTSQPDIDKPTLIQIIHNLAERIDRLETKKSVPNTTINIPPPKESYTEFIYHITIPKLDNYFTNYPKLLTRILTDWLNKDQMPIILYNQTQLYIYINYWRPLVTRDLTNLYNYIVKQITIQLSKWQTEQQDNIVQNERLYEIYSTFILDILSHPSKKIKLIKETIKDLLITNTPS
tara:strand:- start:3261 stop:3815 length:555 start_codon:yes stop_codon:yes gene_type:complete